jgi:hypothetical protein
MLAGHVLEAFLNGDFKSLFEAGLGAVFDGAKNAFKKELDSFNPAKEFMNDLKNWAKNVFNDWMPGADEFQPIEDDVNQVLKSVESEGQQVFQDIANTVQDALGSGTIPAQTDGGLGQTHDIFTPQGQVPMNMGTVPGMGTDAVGTSRSPDGDGSGGYGGGGYGSSGSSSSGGTTPLGGSGGGAGAQAGSSGDSGGTEPPTAADLGLDPNSGAYIEYQPSLNQAVVTYPDGSTQTFPWPPQ